MLELFCAPNSSLENPNYRRPTGDKSDSRTFCAIEFGEMDGAHGYWAEDDETGEVGCLDDFDDVFWIHDDNNNTWFAN